jgi:hypothetical protein
LSDRTSGTSTLVRSGYWEKKWKPVDVHHPHQMIIRAVVLISSRYLWTVCWQYVERAEILNVAYRHEIRSNECSPVQSSTKTQYRTLVSWSIEQTPESSINTCTHHLAYAQQQVAKSPPRTFRHEIQRTTKISRINRRVFLHQARPSENSHPASRHRVISYHDKGHSELQSHWKLAQYQPSFKAEFG